MTTIESGIGIEYVAVASPMRNPVAVLWRLTWNDARLSCALYRAGDGLEMRLESGLGVVFAERVALRPEMVARMRALRASLKRRGWQDPVC